LRKKVIREVRMQTIKPNVKAMLLCDMVITEKGTGKNSLIGIFESISVKQFPCIYGRMGVYINFTGALGKYTFRLELVDVEENVTIGVSTVSDFEVVDKLKTVNLVFILEGLKFNHPGRYEFRFFANDQICENKTFSVEKI